MSKVDDAALKKVRGIFNTPRKLLNAAHAIRSCGKGRCCGLIGLDPNAALRANVGTELVRHKDHSHDFSVEYFRGTKLTHTILACKSGDLVYISKDEEAHALATMLLRLGTSEQALDFPNDTNTPMPRVFNKASVLKKPNGSSVRDKNGYRCIESVPLVDPSALVFEGGNEYYIWRLQEPEFWRNVKAALMVVGILAVCLFKLWPPIIRTIVWYLSLSLLLVIFGVSILQGVVYVLAWLVGYRLWVVPNFGETLSPFDYFTPLYTIEKTDGKARILRVGILGILLAGLGWVATHDMEDFENFVRNQAKIVEDLYSGALLTDAAEVGKDFIPPVSAAGPFGARYGPGRHASRRMEIPQIEDLEKILDDDDESGGATEAEETLDAWDDLQTFDDVQTEAEVEAEAEADE